jgi:cytochrome c oxidase subunit 3
MWVALAAITMTFAAFTSAMVVRQGSANDWRHFTFPPVLYFNTLVLLVSSFTLRISRRRFAAVATGASAGMKLALPTMYLTLALGCVFVAGQYIAWLQLRVQGVYLATAPSSSFFYVFTVLHALHVIGGLIGLLVVLVRLRRLTLRSSTLAATSQYWHFIGALWIYLLLLLRLKI